MVLALLATCKAIKSFQYNRSFSRKTVCQWLGSCNALKNGMPRFDHTSDLIFFGTLMGGYVRRYWPRHFIRDLLILLLMLICKMRNRKKTFLSLVDSNTGSKKPLLQYYLNTVKMVYRRSNDRRIHLFLNSLSTFNTCIEKNYTGFLIAVVPKSPLTISAN